MKKIFKKEKLFYLDYGGGDDFNGCDIHITITSKEAPFSSVTGFLLFHISPAYLIIVWLVLFSLCGFSFYILLLGSSLKTIGVRSAHQNSQDFL